MPIIVALIVFLVLFLWHAQIGDAMLHKFNSPTLAFFLNPTAAQAFQDGSYYLHTNAYDLDAAQAYYEKAYALNPNLGRLNYQLGRVHFLRSDFSTAKKYLNKEIELYSDFARSFYMRALVHGYSGEYDAAINDFNAYISKTPNEWAPYNDLAWIYFKKGDYKNARDAALAGLKLKPDNVWLLTSAGAAALNLKDKKSAKEYLTKAQALANQLDAKSWTAAYPANDPNLAGRGLAEIRAIIDQNLRLAVDN